MALKGWLDVHGHFFLPSSETERKQRNQQMRDACFLVPETWNWSLDDTLAYMDKAGIQLQMLSYLPPDLQKLKAANDFAAKMVEKHPTRFGQLAVIPHDDTDSALVEMDRAVTDLEADGFAVSAVYNGVYFSDPSVEPVWKKLNELKATVFVHPWAYASPTDGRPTPVIDVAFETTKVMVDALYRGLFRRYPDINIIVAHSGGCLPVLSGRLALLGTEPWVPNPEGITKEEVKEQLSRLYVDTAATAETGLQPALKMVGKDHVVYGADCGVPCSTQATMEENRRSVINVGESLGVEGDQIGTNAWKLFPSAAARVEGASK
ncbi:hypothetical protein M8818_007272 [Zalaria obscura]|uniref:Uncharacterized protein n=1 Tax=Zalaria obscura TaxID=2024903 RepID=A0ACC3S5J3_9PEZI